MQGQRWRFIIHGARAGNEELREQVKLLRTSGFEVGVRVTWERGDGARYANEAADEGVDLVLAGGGDGTLNEVAGALASRAEPADRLPALAVLPLGTANDFATAAGIPEELEHAIALARGGSARPIDLVCVDCEGLDCAPSGDGGPGRHRAWFVNVATGGFGAEVTTGTPEELKRNFGRVAYLLTGIRRFGSVRSAHGRFRGNGFAWEGDFLVLAIGNARLAGGGHSLCPDALLDDGLLDLAILPAPPDGSIADVLGTLFVDGRAGLEESAVRVQLAELHVSAAQGMTLNLDGEPISATEFRFRVVPGRLRMPLARTCALFGEHPDVALAPAQRRYAAGVQPTPRPR